MPKFSEASRAHLASCHPKLRALYDEVIQHWDCTIIDGVRTVEEQRKNVAKGVSKTMESKHLPDQQGLGHAVDAMPYPVGTAEWAKIQRGLNAIKRVDPSMEVARCYAFAGFVAGIAAARGIKIRQGWDWNSNRQAGDHSFIDLPHTELVD